MLVTSKKRSNTKCHKSEMSKTSNAKFQTNVKCTMSKMQNMSKMSHFKCQMSKSLKHVKCQISDVQNVKHVKCQMSKTSKVECHKCQKVTVLNVKCQMQNVNEKQSNAKRGTSPPGFLGPPEPGSSPQIS